MCLGVSACVRERSPSNRTAGQTALLLRTVSGPSGGHNPRALRTWRRKHNRRRKQTQTQQQRWHVAWPRVTSSCPAGLPGGLLSLAPFFFFLRLHSSAPWGAFFTHCEAQLSRGTFAHTMWLCWESLTWKTPNKVRPFAEAWLLCSCFLWVATICLGRSGVVVEYLKESATAPSGLVLRLLGGEGGEHCSGRLPWGCWEASFPSA